MAWAQLEPALSALFTRIATIPGTVPSVAGSKSPSVVQARSLSNKFPAPSNPATLHWHPVSVTTVGRDELRGGYVPGTYDAGEDETPLEIPGDTFEPDPENPELRLGGIIMSAHGQRAWTIEVRIETPHQSIPASEHFRALIDSMRLPSVSEELVPTGLAYTGWEKIEDAEYDGEDGRAVSVYIGRLFFNGSSFREDVPITTIEQAQINGVLTP